MLECAIFHISETSAYVPNEIRERIQNTFTYEIIIRMLMALARGQETFIKETLSDPSRHPCRLSRCRIFLIPKHVVFFSPLSRFAYKLTHTCTQRTVDRRRVQIAHAHTSRLKPKTSRFIHVPCNPKMIRFLCALALNASVSP